MSHQHDGTVIVLAPFANDAHAVIDVLARQGIQAERVSSLVDLVARLGNGVGAVVMTEEALTHSSLLPLVEAVRAQPTWSSYPFVLLINQRRPAGQAKAVYGLMPEEIANVMILERPTGIATLTSAIRSALAGRRRQFTTRSHLEELERNAQQQRLMTRELAHRVKNTIAVLQSIVKQTMRPYPEQAEVRETIVERFAALGRAHDLLLGKDFAAAELGDLVRRALSVHPGSFELSGPELELSPQASLSFALVLHELATNSAKYGSMRHPDGSVVIGWTVGREPPGEQSFRFEWKERGGPPTLKPTRTGFGTRLIRSTLSGWGRVSIEYPLEGFRLSFEAPLRELTYDVVPDFGLHEAAATQ